MPVVAEVVLSGTVAFVAGVVFQQSHRELSQNLVSIH